MSIRPLKKSIEAFAVRSMGVYMGAPMGLTLIRMPYKGVIVAAQKVHYKNPPRLSNYLRDVFNHLREEEQAAQLVSVRKPSIPEQADGSHMHHFLIPAGRIVAVVGVTI